MQITLKIVTHCIFLTLTLTQLQKQAGVLSCVYIKTLSKVTSLIGSFDAHTNTHTGAASGLLCTLTSIF